MAFAEFNSRQQELIADVRNLAQGKFAARAGAYDRDVVFPKDDFTDLFEAGLIGAAVPQEYGGSGLGPYSGDVLTLWHMTKEIAKADLSVARCWEGHMNSLVLLAGMGTESQKERWFDGVVRNGEIWVAWSGEPQARASSEKQSFGTITTKVDGGYVVDGSKAFATSAGGAQWAILLVSTAGPGGARHNSGPLDAQLLLACDLSDSSISVDQAWWDPIGMRATVSHVVRFSQTFIPDANLIGRPGQYLADGWQTCFIPHYAATFLGAAEAAYEFMLSYVLSQKKEADPYVQHHVAQSSINVETGNLWLHHVALMWETGRHPEAQAAGNRARHIIEHLAEDTVKRSIRACGARSLNRPSALERIYRDLSFYVRHDNDDHLLATIGKSILGQKHDPSFFKP
ncbi:MAG TPA: acyl-CoA dehydrogenase family protein [Candidatus Angelobacter sp.]|jgi:alkylation response protein AidB-like acyl-CoA dehydrogenase|nr:acyl-CoA dehydrogenase family protein [Candidatus Angelobacter sp.]